MSVYVHILGLQYQPAFRDLDGDEQSLAHENLLDGMEDVNEHLRFQGCYVSRGITPGCDLLFRFYSEDPETFFDFVRSYHQSFLAGFATVHLCSTGRLTEHTPRCEDELPYLVVLHSRRLDLHLHLHPSVQFHHFEAADGLGYGTDRTVMLMGFHHLDEANRTFSEWASDDRKLLLDELSCMVIGRHYSLEEALLLMR